MKQLDIMVGVGYPAPNNFPDFHVRMTQEEQDLAPVNFTVWPVCGQDSDGKTNFFEKKNNGGPVEYTYNPDESDHDFKGFIKWDGCSHLYPTDYIHVCSNWKGYANLMEQLPKLALKLMGKESFL